MQGKASKASQTTQGRKMAGRIEGRIEGRKEREWATVKRCFSSERAEREGMRTVKARSAWPSVALISLSI